MMNYNEVKQAIADTVNVAAAIHFQHGCLDFMVTHPVFNDLNDVLIGNDGRASHALKRAFCWRDTPQGSEYWAEVFILLTEKEEKK